MKVKSLSCVQLSVTPWTTAHQAPPSMGFSRQEYWSGVPLPSLGSTFSHLQKPSPRMAFPVPPLKISLSESADYTLRMRVSDVERGQQILRQQGIRRVGEPVGSRHPCGLAVVWGHGPWVLQVPGE